MTVAAYEIREGERTLVILYKAFHLRLVLNVRHRIRCRMEVELSERDAVNKELKTIT